MYAASADDRRLTAAIETRTIAVLIAPFAARAKAADACPRARLAVSELLGLAVSRYVLCQEPLASSDHETIAAWAGPALDYFLRGELGRTA
ncbi:MAG: TetR/AcrR family transcriptional regulator [Thermoleophilia bacterium]